MPASERLIIYMPPVGVREESLKSEELYSIRRLKREEGKGGNPARPMLPADSDRLIRGTAPHSNSHSGTLGDQKERIGYQQLP